MTGAACDAAKNLQTAENGLQVLEGRAGIGGLIPFSVVVMVAAAAISAATTAAVIAAAAAAAAAISALAEDFV